MAKLFNFFPRTFYSSNDGNSVDTVTNIIARFGFENSLKENTSAFYKYEVQDGDTPEIVAHKYYGNAERHWIVLMFNDIVDPQFDWPLEDRNLMDYIETKYSATQYSDKANTGVSGLSYAKSTENRYTYFKIITRTNDFDGTQLVEKIEIHEGEYNNLPSISEQTFTLQNGETVTETIEKQIQTYYDYELELNESKRKINLLKKEFVPAIEKEFKKVIRGK